MAQELSLHTAWPGLDCHCHDPSVGNTQLAPHTFTHPKETPTLLCPCHTHHWAPHNSPPCSSSPLLLLPTEFLHHRDHRRNLRRGLLFILTLIVIFSVFLKHRKSCSFLLPPCSSLARAHVFCSSLLKQQCRISAVLDHSELCSAMKWRWVQAAGFVNSLPGI